MNNEIGTEIIKEINKLEPAASRMQEDDTSGPANAQRNSINIKKNEKLVKARKKNP